MTGLGGEPERGRLAAELTALKRERARLEAELASLEGTEDMGAIRRRAATAGAVVAPLALGWAYTVILSASAVEAPPAAFLIAPALTGAVLSGALAAAIGVMRWRAEGRS